MALTSVKDIDWRALRAGRVFHPSPAAWEDQVLYFFLVDRFSDGNEDGYLDAQGNPAAGTTPRFDLGRDHGNATATPADRQRWWDAGAGWVGGTLRGARTKLGYVKRLGATAVWVSPVLKQVSFLPTYHGYAVQDFLAVDPHFGSTQDLVDFVAAAHDLGLYVMLDVIVNHAGDVFAYDADRYPAPDGSMDPRWDGSPYRVKGFRTAFGNPDLPFGRGVQPPVSPFPNDAVWPVELQQDGAFTCRGRISNWDNEREYLEGDFGQLKDLFHGWGEGDGFVPSPALRALTDAMKYWIATADLDAFRIDTVKHMAPDATRNFTTAIREFTESLGKDNFYLLGEVAGGRDFAFDTMETTGLDGALGIASFGLLEDVAKGRADPNEYFQRFRNSRGVAKGSHRWFRNTVVTGFADHDHIGRPRRRFCADPDAWKALVGAVALDVLTLGIPCLYYGTEQGFDGKDDEDDRALREAMFGGAYGSLQSRGRHFFDERSWIYQATAGLLALRARKRPLRMGRQYLREISGDGVGFGLPQRIGPRLESIVAWSRLFDDDPEVLVAVNVDTASPRTAWVTVDAGRPRAPGATFGCLYAFDPALASTGAPTPLLPSLAIQARNGQAVQLTLPPGGVAVFEG
jgi:glycosidase